jgi:hypothetical protein
MLTNQQVTDLSGRACTGDSAEPEPDSSLLMMVVDLSSSMSTTAAGTGSQTKWQVTRDALLEAVAALPPTMGVGMLLYPNLIVKYNTGDSNTCVNTKASVPVTLLGDASNGQRASINSALQQAQPQTCTPTHDAYRLALEAFQASSSAATGRFLLLITDGQPTLSLGCMEGPCDNPTDVEVIINEIAGAKASGIRTFIIGSPGSEQNLNGGSDARSWLSRAAQAGGTDPAGCSHAGPNFCHFDMVQQPDFVAGLRVALASIAGQVVSCSYTPPNAPAGEKLDPNRVNLIYTSGQGTNVQVLRSGSSTCTEGWYYGTDGKINLCSATCEKVLNDSGAGVELLFGCAANIDPVE